MSLVGKGFFYEGCIIYIILKHKPQHMEPKYPQMNTPSGNDLTNNNSKQFAPYRYAGFTPAQKWEEVVKMRKMAWNLKTAMVKCNHPDWSDKQVYDTVKEIFLYATT